jgi:hypothetical protein
MFTKYLKKFPPKCETVEPYQCYTERGDNYAKNWTKFSTMSGKSTKFRKYLLGLKMRYFCESDVFSHQRCIFTRKF